MKSYTDISQSRKLAEILPVESADMSWAGTGLGKPFARTIPCKGYPEEICPCWSLAALLDVLPMRIDNGRHCLALINSNPSDEINWLCCYKDYKGNLITACYADNQVDACVEMIYKLKERNLL